MLARGGAAAAAAVDMHAAADSAPSVRSPAAAAVVSRSSGPGSRLSGLATAPALVGYRDTAVVDSKGSAGPDSGAAGPPASPRPLASAGASLPPTGAPLGALPGASGGGFDPAPEASEDAEFSAMMDMLLEGVSGPAKPAAPRKAPPRGELTAVAAASARSAAVVAVGAAESRHRVPVPAAGSSLPASVGTLSNGRGAGVLVGSEHGPGSPRYGLPGGVAEGVPPPQPGILSPPVADVTAGPAPPVAADFDALRAQMLEMYECPITQVRQIRV